MLEAIKARLAERRMAFYPIRARANTVSLGTWSPSDELLTRIKRAYRLSIAADDTAGDSMWNGINARKGAIHDALLSDNGDLKRLLTNPAKTSLYLGVDSLTADRHQTLSNAVTLNCLVRLAEAVGARRLWNVESPRHAARLEPRPNDVDVEAVLSQIERAARLTINFPNPFAGEVGIATSRGIMGYRALQAIYQAWRLREVSSLFGLGGDTIEIGAGAGRTAYYSRMFGLGPFTVVDLPLTNVGQACFLAATLGDDGISLYGEEDGHSRIRLLPPQALTGDASDYDIALNVDSFAEMTETVARGYIEHLTTRVPVFISINHESWPTRAYSILLEHHPLLLRSPYWMRKGYVEEIALFSEHALRIDTSPS